MSTVTIGIVDDHVFVRHAAGADATRIGAVRLAASGGVIDVAIDDPGTYVDAEIWDATAAAWWLPSVFGDRVTEDVIAAAERTGQEPEGDLDAFADDDAPLLDTIRRLAVALWLRRWHPAHVDGRRATLLPWLLDAEAATLAVDANIALSQEFPLAKALVSPHLIHLAAGVASHSERVDGGDADALIDTVLLAAAEDALELTPPETPGWTALAEALTAHGRDEALVAEAMAGLDDAFVRLDATVAAAAVLAGSPVAAGDDGTASRRWTAPADPRSVPARVVSFEDDAISWTATSEPDGMLRIDVVVEAAHSTTHTLFVRVDLGDEGDAAALSLTDRGYTASLWLHSDAEPAAARVSVYGGIPFADTLPNRPVHERDADRQEILRLVHLRQSAVRGGTIGADTWDAPFAAEVANRARTRLR